MSLSSNLDPQSVYNPPFELKYPEGELLEKSRPDSPQSSSSSSDSDLSSPSFNRDSELEYAKQKMETAVPTKTVSSVFSDYYFFVINGNIFLKG